MKVNKLFNNRNFLLQWCGQSISGLGTWINFVGLNLYVYQITGSGKILGAFLVVRMLPAILFGSVGGYLADRYSRRSIMIICDSIRAVLVLGFLFTDNIWLFFIIGFLLSAIDKIFMAANGAFLPNIVEKEKLLEANSLNRMTYSVIMVLGPALGALLVNAFSYKIVFIVDSVSFIVSVICTAMINVSGAVSKAEKSAGIIEEFKVAFLFFKAHSAMLFLTAIRLIDALGSGSYNTALPIFSRSFQLEKGAAYGWLVAFWAMGEFTGSLLTNVLSKKIQMPPQKMFSLSVLMMALGLGLTFHSGSILFAIIAIYLGGMGDGISNVIFNTMLMKESPDEMRGKIYGSTVALVFTVVAIGMAGAGFFIDKYPLHYTTDFCTILIILGVVIGYFSFLYAEKKKSVLT